MHCSSSSDRVSRDGPAAIRTATPPGASFTAAVVVSTLWLLGAVGWSAELIGIEHEWLNSPIGLGA